MIPTFIKREKLFLLALLLAAGSIFHTSAQQKSTTKSLAGLQQQFIDLSFGMFIHYNIPTYMEDDWADPNASPDLFNPTKLNTDQWAAAAKSAHMAYGCLTTKHHSGFAIWDTKTTTYNVMNSPIKKDVVKAYTESFRKQGLKVFLYYSILDTHNKIRPGYITRKDVQFIKDQLTELLSNYGEISAMIIDGWDAPWSRISYDTVPFEEIYSLIKSLQPNCLVMDLNAAKYPAEALFYTDIKSYEMGAGQRLSKDQNKLPALACLPLNDNWFWKPSFPDKPVKDVNSLVNETLIPLNKAYCNFILNVAPNREGLIDDNAVAALKKIGTIYKNPGKLATLPVNVAPIISSNLAKRRPANGSWSNDMWIFDFANDDDFGTNWLSHDGIKEPWMEVQLDKEEGFNMIVISEERSNIDHYILEYFQNNQWHHLLDGDNTSRIKIHRFDRVYGEKVRIKITGSHNTPSIAEFGVYNERR